MQANIAVYAVVIGAGIEVIAAGQAAEVFIHANVINAIVVGAFAAIIAVFQRVAAYPVGAILGAGVVIITAHRLIDAYAIHADVVGAEVAVAGTNVLIPVPEGDVGGANAVAAIIVSAGVVVIGAAHAVGKSAIVYALFVDADIRGAQNAVVGACSVIGLMLAGVLRHCRVKRQQKANRKAKQEGQAFKKLMRTIGATTITGQISHEGYGLILV